MTEHNTGYRLLFVHGAGQDGSCWHRQTEFFKHAEAVTLPGHRTEEYTDNEGRASIEEYASWLHDWITAEYTVDGIREKTILVGHSMGGAIALTYALMYGDWLSGLVLAGTGAKLRVNHQILDLLQKDYGKAVEFLTDNSFTATASAELKETNHQVMFRMQPEVTLRDFMACNNYDVSQRLTRLGNLPTLVVTGAADVMTPPRLAEFLQQNIKNSRLEIIDAAPHNLMLEKPDEFNAILDNFIASLDG